MSSFMFLILLLCGSEDGGELSEYIDDALRSATRAANCAAKSIPPVVLLDELIDDD